MEIILAGTIDFPDMASRDGVLERSATLQAASRAEPGCLAYVFSADPAVPTRIQVFEHWTDADSLTAHFSHPNYDEMRNHLRSGGRIASEVAKYAISQSGPVYDESRTARADFF